jgi:hypothetical protein
VLAARADGISGYLEFNFASGDSESKDISGSSESKSTLFSQRYRLILEKQFYPTLLLSAGGTFDRADGTNDLDGVKSDQTSSRVIPYVELMLNTPLLSLGGGYRLDEEWAKANGVSTPRLVREQTYGRLGYRPDGFPTLDLQIGRTENYDTGRTFRDITEDYLNVSSRYSPVSNLQLSYFGAFSDVTDKLRNNEVRTAQNSGSVSYSRNFLQNRVAVSGMYNVLDVRSEFTRGGTGDITLVVSPFSGLAALTDTPDQVTLLPNTALIDGNTAAGSGIDIGVPPPLGDARPRNIGLDFVVTPETNLLYVWVDKRLPDYVANTYTWSIYTSNNNREWVLHQVVAPAPFAPFDNRFEIPFQNVVSRYVKVVTRPLASLPPPTVDFPDPSVFRNIQVTELQALIRKPAAAVSGQDSRLSQTLNLDGRARLLDVPSLFYQVSYYRADTTDAPARYSVANALSVNHQFSKVFSGSARVEVDYSEDGSGHTLNYLYDASLTAVPLPTLTHTLSYSGRTAYENDAVSAFNNFYLNNTAELYKGINANLGGGVNFNTLDNGVKTQGVTLSAGLSLVPNSRLTIGMSYSGNTSERTGGGVPDLSVFSRTGSVNVSYTPLRAVYLYGDWSITSQTGNPQFTTFSVSAGWTPFPDGTLHFNIPYQESHRSSDNSTDRSFFPGVRWNITRRATLDLSYAWFHSESNFSESESNVYSANLRIPF